MKNYNSVLTGLRWNAGELLPGHQFRIHDLAVQKNSGKIVILTGVCKNGENYSFISLDDLETDNAPCGSFQKPSEDAVTPEHEVLKRKLIRIKGCRGMDHWQKVLKAFLAG